MNTLEALQHRNAWGQEISRKFEAIPVKWGDLKDINDVARVYGEVASGVRYDEHEDGLSVTVYYAYPYSSGMAMAWRRKVKLHIGEDPNAEPPEMDWGEKVDRLRELLREIADYREAPWRAEEALELLDAIVPGRS